MNPKSKTNLKVALVIAILLAFIVLICGILAGCKAPLPPPPPQMLITKSLEPPDPCPDCPKDTNYHEPIWPPLNTNSVYLWQGEVINQPGQTPPVHFVVWAFNLTNGVTYHWERAQENLQDWLPLTSFVATTNTASRTNGIPNPERPYYFRLRWQQ